MGKRAKHQEFPDYTFDGKEPSKFQSIKESLLNQDNSEGQFEEQHEFDNNYGRVLRTMTFDEPSQNRVIDKLSEHIYLKALQEAILNDVKLESMNIKRLEKYIKRANIQRNIDFI